MPFPITISFSRRGLAFLKSAGAFTLTSRSKPKAHAKKPPSHTRGGETGGDIATLCCCSKRSRHPHPAVGAPDSAMRANYLMALACRERFFYIAAKLPVPSYQLA